MQNLGGKQSVLWAIGKQRILWGRVYKSESLGLEQSVIFQDTDQLVENFSLDQGNRELALKNKNKNQIGFVLAGLC